MNKNALQHLYAFSLAWSLCTTVPLPKRCFPPQITSQESSRSVLYYPLVGAILAIVLFSLGTALHSLLPAFLTAVLITGIWVALTGAMHLDGLADCVDAYFASHKDREFTLNVFKDVHCGPMAVVALVLLLLLKVAALTALIQADYWGWPLLGALLLSRWLIFPYMLYTPYVSSQGLASQMHVKPWKKSWLLGSVIVVVMLAAMLPWLAVVAVISLVLAVCWRALWIKKIGGYVGDCLGAMVELVEALTLLMAVFLCF